MKQFVRGFEYYVNVTRTSRPIHHHVVGGDVNARLLPWLRAHRDERFFLFVHYWDPHTPYNQPGEFARPFVHVRGSMEDLPIVEAPAGYRYVPGWHVLEQIPSLEGPEDYHPARKSPQKHPMSVDSYDGEILYTDHLIDQVLQELDSIGILDRTAVVINADHGEQLKQHYDCWGHPGLHDGNVFTPLILWRPGLLTAGRRPEGYAHHIDIAPTILDLLSIPSPEGIDGRSLLPSTRGEQPVRDEYVAETMGMRSLTKGGWKYIWHKCPPDELYDLASDPLEQVNLVTEHRDRTEALKAELLDWVERRLGGRNDPMLYQLGRAEEMRGEPCRFM
jgi:arylsulfatase A-like enzyme